MLLDETALPRTCKVGVENHTDKMQLHQNVRRLLAGCKENDHICLLGLQEQKVPKSYDEAHELGFGASPLGRSGSEVSGSISQFHERVLKTVAEILYQEETKYVSFLPGGFAECHDFIQRQNLVQLQKMCLQERMEPQFLQFLDPHESGNCYTCHLHREEAGNQGQGEGLQTTFGNKGTAMTLENSTYSVSSPFVVIDESTGDFSRRTNLLTVSKMENA